jgi:hypothetical protein
MAITKTEGDVETEVEYEEAKRRGILSRQAHFDAGMGKWEAKRGWIIEM